MKASVKLLCLLLAALLVMSLAACDTAPAEDTKPTAAPTTGNTDPTDTVPADPTDPAQTDPADPTQTDPTEPAQTDPADPTDPTQTDPTEPTGSENTDPTDPTDPPATKEGTKEHPKALTIGSNTAAPTGNGGYYFSWTASQDGTLILTMPSSNWAYEIHNLTAGEGVTLTGKSNDDPKPNPVQVSVYKGDSLQIIVNTLNGVRGNVKFTSEFSTDIMGSQENPFIVKIGAVSGIRVPAGQTLYFSGRVHGTNMTVRNAAGAKLVFQKKEYAASNGVIQLTMPQAEAGKAQPLLFAITNTAGSEQVYTVEFEIPVGTLENPKQLTLGSHTVSITAGSQGYYYEWKATANGTFTVQMDGSNWYYQVYNLDSYKVEEGNSRDSSTNPISIEVKAGQTVRITVNTGDAKAADVTFTASFK